MTAPMPIGTTKIDEKGYVKIVDPDHPLAVGRWVLAHRVALYEVIGPQDHPCLYCGWILPWRHPNGYRWCINVDHINTVKTDNRPSNLVVSCWHCNANRSWGHDNHEIYLELVEETRHIHPAERPPVIEWLVNKLTIARAA